LYTNPAQIGAVSGTYSTLTSGGYKSNFGFGALTTDLTRGDIWKITVDESASVSFSIDFTNTLLNIDGAYLYQGSVNNANLMATGGAAAELTNAPFAGMGVTSVTFSPLTLAVGQTYYMRITGKYVNNNLNRGTYTIATPASSLVTVATPIPAAAWLFGTGIIGLVGAAKRKKAQASNTLAA
jgi:hypothetical protein